MTEALEPFLANMQNISKDDKFKSLREPRYTEEWMETFLAWSEVEQDEV